MTKPAKLYLFLISALGISLGLWCSIRFFTTLPPFPEAFEPLGMFFILFLLCILSRALPLYISEDRALDISFISILCSLLVLGAVPATAIVFLSTPFVVELGPKRGDPARHIFNIPPIKTCFNVSNLVLSVLLPGQLFHLLGGRPGEIVFPQILLPTLVFVVLSLILNAILFALLLTLGSGGRFWSTLSHILVLMLPNLLGVPPMGLLMSILLLMPSGVYLIVIFLVPLLLARYSFKLYLNSRQGFYRMVQTLVATIEAKDTYTEGHSKRVSYYAQAVANTMKLSSKQVELVRVAALLHDVGKIGIDDALLNKAGVLTDEEWHTIQQHPLIGARILEHSDMDPRIQSIVLHHHERHDGSGYPDGLTGEELSLEAAILGVADAYDAMTSDRSYRYGISHQEALDILRRERGRQFHPQVVDAFIIMAERGLKDGTLPGQPTASIGRG